MGGMIGLDPKHISSFPWVEVGICGLRQYSNYWASLALDWLMECNPIMRFMAIDALEQAIDSKWIDQETRQKCDKVLKDVIVKTAQVAFQYHQMVEAYDRGG